jgi:hypothetical protein
MSGKVGEKFICKDCGVESVRTLRNQTLCENCRDAGRAKYMYEKNKEYRKIWFSNVNNEPETPKPKPKFSLTEVSLMARRCNMSYGQYVAQWKLGNVPEPIKLEKPKKKRGRKCKGT